MTTIPICSPWDKSNRSSSGNSAVVPRMSRSAVRGGPFTSAADDTPEQLYALWQGAVARSRSRAGGARRPGVANQWRRADFFSGQRRAVSG